MKVSKSFTRFTGFVLIYTIAVVLWGAFVRATGSGAGCGAHWPSCGGEIIPRAPQVETIIEFTHRVTSGLSLLFVVALFIWAYRSMEKGHPVRLGATLSLAFVISEALVGAALVLFEWTGTDASAGRAVSIAVHLLNTFLLLGSLTLTYYWANGGPAVQLRGHGLTGLALVIGLVGVVLLGMTGAITALGDTLFPAGSLAEGLAQDLDPTAHFLIRLRVWHPMIAVTVGFFLLFTAGLLRYMHPDAGVRKWAVVVGAAFLVQLAAGLVNLVLLAPVWMQIVHLLLADIVWITLVRLSAEALPRRESRQSVLEGIPAATD